MAGMVCDACMVGFVWMVGMLCKSVGYGMLDLTLWYVWYVWSLECMVGMVGMCRKDMLNTCSAVRVHR